MTKYKITVDIESDDDYTDGEQIEDLRKDISMVIADYNCFLQIGDIKIEETRQGLSGKEAVASYLGKPPFRPYS